MDATEDQVQSVRVRRCRRSVPKRQSSRFSVPQGSDFRLRNGQDAAQGKVKEAR
jgi:hypothetical protein